MMKLFSATRGAIMALGLSALYALPVHAQEAPEVTEDVVVGVLKGEGLSAEVAYDDWTGAPFISSRWEPLKAGFEVTFDACDEDGFDCGMLIFSAGFFFNEAAKTPAATHEKINEWNINHWGKSFVDDEGTMWITMEVNISGGASKASLTQVMRNFGTAMGEYTDFIGWQAD